MAQGNFAFLYALCAKKKSRGSFKITKMLFNWLLKNYSPDDRHEIYKQISKRINFSEFFIYKKIENFLREKVPELANMLNDNIFVQPLGFHHRIYPSCHPTKIFCISNSS